MKTTAERKQRDIQREQDAMKIFATLRRYQVNIDNGSMEYLAYKGIRWTAETIAVHSGLIPIGGDRDYTAELNRVHRALLLLCARQWVEMRGKQFFVTLFGCDAYSQETASLPTGADEQKFRTEALTGCTSQGRQSALRRAALPSGGAACRSATNTTETAQLDRCTAVQYLREVAEDNGVTAAEAEAMLSTGEIHRCNHCGKLRTHHRRGARTGQKWQSACIVCRKRERK